jgi:hypothetical protein
MSNFSSFKNTIIRVCNVNNEYFGAGILLQPNLVLTCAHVVANALGESTKLKAAPKGKLQLNLPFVSEKETFSAEVIHNGWYPNRPDLAILRLCKPLDDCSYASLSPSLNLNNLLDH